MAYTDQPVAAMMPSDTSVSMDTPPCRALASAARWKGQAAHRTTGAASAMRTHCQPGKRTLGSSERTSDRSLSGTKNTSARTSRRHRRAAPAAASSGASSAPPTTVAEYPAASTAPIRSATDTCAGAVTVARSVARLTAARTWSSRLSLRSIRAAHAAQVMPWTASSIRTVLTAAVSRSGTPFTASGSGRSPW